MLIDGLLVEHVNFELNYVRNKKNIYLKKLNKIQMFFELEDIKRRHSLYYDVYNVGGWVPTPDNTLRWNVARGAMVGTVSTLASEFIHNFYVNWQLLAREYRTPTTFQQLGTYIKTTLNMENFKKSWSTRAQYALCAGGIDWASRIAAYRWINNGWQSSYGSFEYAFPRKVPGTAFISALTCWVGVPFEVARMAYYGDKTFPRELQRGYSSYFNALFRIPFEEGPYYLFKNSFPIYARNFFQTLTLLYSFDFLKDKCSFMWRVSEMPYYPCKVAFAAISTYLALIFSYPFYMTREMVDFWPKNKAIGDAFKGNYRRAGAWIWFSEFFNNYYPGMLKNYAYRHGPQMFFTVMLADSLGIFSYWRVNHFSGPGTNSWEDSFY